MYNLSQKSLERLQGVHPDLVKVMRAAIKISPIDFGISQGVRTLKEQEDLYAKGRTAPGDIVTWTMNSKHLKQSDGYGHAVDIACYINGKVTWVESYYETVAQCISEVAEQLGINIKWGGNFTKNKDRPHFELLS